MGLTVDDNNVVYVTIIFTKNSIPIRLGAKSGSGKYSAWIEPEDPIETAKEFENCGLECRNSELFLDDQKLKTLPLKRVLESFFAFLQKSSRPVIILSHSGDYTATYLTAAILIYDMANMFRDVIAGFTDSVLNFAAMFPSYRDIKAFKLWVLYQNITGRNYTGAFFDVDYELTAFQELVTEFLTWSGFSDHILPYEVALTLLSEMNESNDSDN